MILSAIASSTRVFRGVVAVEGGRLHAELVGEPAHGQVLQPVRVDQFQCRVADAFAAEQRLPGTAQLKYPLASRHRTGHRDDPHRTGIDADQRTGRVLERLAQALPYTTDEEREGAEAFLAKRTPSFTGR